MERASWVIAVCACLVLAGSAAAVPTYEPESGFEDPAIHVDRQETNGTVVVSRAIAATQGYVVIHADAAGAPGPVVGHSDVIEPGLNVGVPVDVNLSAGEGNDTRLHAMLHVDDGDGEYEFPGPDTPERNESGIVVQPFLAHVTDGTTAVAARHQPLDDGAVAMDRVDLRQSGWLVVHLGQGGGPGPVIGHSELLEAGTHRSVQVPIDTAMLPAGEDVVRLWGMAHVGDGNGTYDFPDGDPPVTVNGTPVMTPFLTNTITPILEASDQIVDGSTIKVSQATVPGKTWLVVHPQAQGGGPQAGAVLAQRMLDAGSHTNLALDIGEDVTATRTVYPMLHWDDPFDGNFTFPADGDPAVTKGGQAVILGIDLTPAGTGDGGMDGGTDGGTDGADGNQSPGPGLAAAVLAVSIAGLWARRRD